MPRKRCNKPSKTEDHENKRIIEKWMKRNSSNKLIIGQDEKPESLKSKPKNSSLCDIKVSERKKVVIPVEISEQRLNKLTSIKRSHSFPINSDANNAPKAKIFRQSLQQKGASISTIRTNVSMNIVRTPKLANKTKPSIEIIPTNTASKISPKPTKLTNETVPIIEVIKTTNNIIGSQVNHQQILNPSTGIIKRSVEKFISTLKGNEIVKTVSTSTKSNVTEISPLAKGNQIVKHSSSPTVKCNVVRTPKIKVDTTNIETNVGGTNSEENNLLKEKDDVYKCLLENYRYLVIPKEWSVNEWIKERKNRYIVFFNNQVIEEKGILISVIKKSLIIDKGGTLNYSVHGLPIDTKQTILPKTLDNIKKLLSILHIFDKMQVCEGVGFDSNEVQNNVIFKDCYRYWRHRNCKIILVKATRCSECIDAKNALQKRSVSQPNIVKQEIEFVDVSVKTEDILSIS